ncbi:MAG: hypothetical protein IKQ81_03440 [Clostridiales bacterium]|nr:hypothetical protein [Clostridiales bacterium]
MLTHGIGDMAVKDVNGHYSARVAVECDEMLGAVSEALDEVGVSWNSVTVGGDEFDNSDNAALGFKEIGIGSVVLDDDAAPYAYYIIEFDPDACVIKGIDVGNELKLFRESTDDYTAAEMQFVVSAVNGNCVLCVLDAKNGPVLSDSYDEDDEVLATLFEAFGEK